MMNNFTTKEIQNCILSIAKDLDCFCRDNNITYFLMSGSALGAMRHKGFIPWDDDMDVFMTMENYNRFLKLFAEKGNKKYYLQHEDTDEWPLYISRICLKGTTMISNEFKYNMKQHHNVFIDVICLFSAAPTYWGRWRQSLVAQVLRVNSLEKAHFPQKTPWKWMCQKMSRWIVNSWTKQFFLQYVKKYEGEQGKWVGYYFGRVRFPKTNFPRAFLGDGSPRYVPFEDTELPVFQHVEEYLNSRFGTKWMELPDKKTLEQYPIHSDFVDLEHDYTEYITPDGKGWIFDRQ